MLAPGGVLSRRRALYCPRCLLFDCAPLYTKGQIASDWQLSAPVKHLRQPLDNLFHIAINHPAGVEHQPEMFVVALDGGIPVVERPGDSDWRTDDSLLL